MRPQQSPSNLSYQKVSLQTQSRLIDTFYQYKVPEFYQNVFINYVKNQQGIQAELSMRQQIQSLSNNSSFIQSFTKFSAEKQKYEGYTRLVLGYQKQTYESQAAKIIKTCEMIIHMREIHYKLAYSLLKIRQKYEENVQIHQSIEKYYYNTFAIKLDSFRKELQRTELSRYIDFQKEYDPFFLHLKLKQYHKDQKCNEALQLLMQFPVQDSYKYLKMQKIMADWLYMHSKKKIQERNLDTIDLPELKNNPRTFQGGRFGDKIFRNSNQFQKQRDNQINYFRENRSSTFDIDSVDRKMQSEPNRQSDIFSLQKYQKQKKYRNKEQSDREYLNENINKLLERNITTPVKSDNNRLKAKTQASSNEPNGSTFIGRIKRFKVSNVRTVQNSPVAHQSKRSETLPVYPRQEANKDRFNDHNRSSPIRASLTPQCLYYDSQNDSKEQKARSISKNRIKLEKINAYEITIRGIKRNNDLIETSPVAKKESLKNNDKDEKLTQNNSRAVSKTIDPQMASTLRQGGDFKTQESINTVDNKKQQKLTKTQQKSAEVEPQKNESLKKKNAYDEDELLRRNQVPYTIKKGITPIDENRKQSTIKEKDEQMEPALPTKISDQEDLIKRKTANNPPKVILQTDTSNQTKPIQQTNQSNPLKPTQQAYQSNPPKTQQKVTTDKNKIQPQKESVKTVTQKPTNQTTQRNINPQPEKTKPVQQKIEEPSSSKPIPKKEQSIIKSESKIQSSQIKQEKRQIKMRVGKYTLQSFKEYLKNYQCHEDSQKLFDLSKISKELQFQQAYITQFLVNSQPGVLAIIYIIANCKLILRAWSLQVRQDPNLSFPLLKKFIDYVQKQITNQCIYYKGASFPELTKLGFVMKKKDLYQRERTTQPREIEQEFEQCISMQCSQIKFIQKQKEDILVSAEIQNFTVQNSNMSPLLLNMDQEAIPQKLKQLIKISHKIDGFKMLNKVLQNQDCDSYQSGSKIVVQNIDLSLINFLSDFRDAFVASEGFIKFYGNLVKQTEQQEIYCIKLAKNNGRVCFCKGYQSAQQVQKHLKQQTQKKVEFWVPMFNKKLYGRFKNYKNPTEVCYANWDISVCWQDELQGAIKYPERAGVTFQQSPFYVSIQLQGNLLYIFQVNEDDYIY